MFRHKLFGIAAAATLGLAAALGSTGAYAVKIVESATADPTADDALASVTYAAETLLMGETTEASEKTDTAVYYDIAGVDLFISAPADIAATTGDTYVVAFTLEGMVIQDAVGAGDLNGATFSLASGGASGDKLVVFRLTTGAVATDTNLALEANFAISAGGSGTITRTVTNQTLASLNIPGVDGAMTHTGSGIIKVAAALDEKATKLNPTAEVADSFKMFMDDATTASVGTLMVGFKADHRIASGSDAGDAVDALTDIIITADNTATPPAPSSTVSFMGDFSFASKVFIHGDSDCGADPNAVTDGDPDTALAETQLLMMEDDEVSDTTMTVAVNVTAFATSPQHLCIMVQGEDTDDMAAPRIPATTAYTAMGSYTGIEDASIGPMPDMQTLGRIKRNGTTVNLPYLTTNAKFSQRVRIVNRGGAALYTIALQTGDTPEEVEGTLDEKSVTDLMVGGENGIIDTIAGGRGATAGTLIIESQPSMIDVVTIQISRELGTTDTVEYQPEPE